MGLFIDPRAFGVRPIENGEVHLVDRDTNPIAVATEYDGWWGVCSVRSRITISRRAETYREVTHLLMSMVWFQGEPMDQDQYAHHDALSRAGSLYIRSLTDEQVLEAARNKKSAAWKRIFEWMGPQANHCWITSQCAEVAYTRGVMDAQEMDWICR